MAVLTTCLEGRRAFRRVESDLRYTALAVFQGRISVLLSLEQSCQTKDFTHTSVIVAPKRSVTGELDDSKSPVQISEIYFWVGLSGLMTHFWVPCARLSPD